MLTGPGVTVRYIQRDCTSNSRQHKYRPCMQCNLWNWSFLLRTVSNGSFAFKQLLLLKTARTVRVRCFVPNNSSSGATCCVTVRIHNPAQPLQTCVHWWFRTAEAGSRPQRTTKQCSCASQRWNNATPLACSRTSCARDMTCTWSTDVSASCDPLAPIRERAGKKSVLWRLDRANGKGFKLASVRHGFTPLQNIDYLSS